MKFIAFIERCQRDVVEKIVSGYESSATWFKVGGIDSQRLMVTIWTTGVDDRGVGIVEGLVVDGG
jgi:hypothetical protein